MGSKRRKVTNELSKVIDYSDPFSVPNLLESLNSSKYGSVTKDVEALLARNMQVFMFNRSSHPVAMHTERNINITKDVASVPVEPVVILDSDEEEVDAVQKPSYSLMQIDIQKQAEELLLQRSVQGQDNYLLDLSSSIGFLKRLLKPLASDNIVRKTQSIDSKLLALRKDVHFSRDMTKKLDQSDDAIAQKVREILVSCKDIKASGDNDQNSRPELSPKWIALLTMEKACLSNVSFEGKKISYA